MKIVTLGRTGLIGSRVVSLLRARSHEVVAASPSKGIDSITGKGLTEALTGAQVVVDVTNAPSWEDKAVLEFFETSTRNVFAAEEKKAWATTFFASVRVPAACIVASRCVHTLQATTGRNDPEKATSGVNRESQKPRCHTHVEPAKHRNAVPEWKPSAEHKQYTECEQSGERKQ